MSDWEALDVVQLKGALIRRGLDTEGTKEQLVQRLQEYDAENAEPAQETNNVAGEEQMEADTTPADGTEAAPAAEAEKDASEVLSSAPPMIQRPRILEVYKLADTLRSVVIYPCTREVLTSASFTYWLAEASDYSVKKYNGGNSAAYMYFSTLEVGEDAFRELYGNLNTEEVTVAHHVHTDDGEDVDAWLEDYIAPEEDFDLSAEAALKRLVVLENLPPTVTDSELATHFPGCRSVLNFVKDEGGEGVAFVEMLTADEVKDWVTKYKDNPLLVQECVILVSGYLQRFNVWQRLHQLETARLKKAGLVTPETSDPVTDAERQTMLDRIKELKRMIQEAFDNVEWSSEEKMERLRDWEKELAPLVHSATRDTANRIKKKLDIPEPEEEQLPEVKAAIEKEKQRKERKEEKKQNKAKNQPQQQSQKGGFQDRGRGRGNRGGAGMGGPKQGFKRQRMNEGGFGFGYDDFGGGYGYDDGVPPLMGRPYNAGNRMRAQQMLDDDLMEMRSRRFGGGSFAYGQGGGGGFEYAEDDYAGFYSGFNKGGAGNFGSGGRFGKGRGGGGDSKFRGRGKKPDNKRGASETEFW